MNFCIRLVVGCWSVVVPILLSCFVVFNGGVGGGLDFQLVFFLLFVVLESSVVVCCSFLVIIFDLGLPVGLVLSMLSLRTGLNFDWAVAIISVSCSCLLFTILSGLARPYLGSFFRLLGPITLL